MRLVAEAGGTKISWVLIANNERVDFSTVGYNPLQNDSNYLRQIMISGFPKEWAAEDVSEISYFGTGCASNEGKNRVERALKHFFVNASNVNVFSDLEAVGVAFHNNQPGIVGVLGTGASVAYYNGLGIDMPVPSLGYLLGDEGSGAYLGKVLLAKILRKELDVHVVKDFYESYQLTEKQIIPTIYQSKKPASLLASYALFLSKHKDNRGVGKIIDEALDLFIEKHLKPIIDICSEVPIAFVGSVAFGLNEVFQAKVKQLTKGKLIIEKSPLEGLI